MVKNKYCDTDGKLFELYSTFYQFGYFYRNNKDIRKYYISGEEVDLAIPFSLSGWYNIWYQTNTRERIL